MSIEEQKNAADETIESAAQAPEKSRTLWSDAWKRLKKNKLALIGAVWILFVIVVALTADLWAPQWLGSPTQIDSTTVAQTSKLPP